MKACCSSGKFDVLRTSCKWLMSAATVLDGRPGACDSSLSIADTRARARDPIQRMTYITSSCFFGFSLVYLFDRRNEVNNCGKTKIELRRHPINLEGSVSKTTIYTVKI
jgi:hypothetical protein